MTASKLIPPSPPTPGSPRPPGNLLTGLLGKLPDVVKSLPLPVVGAVVLGIPALAFVVLTMLNNTPPPEGKQWVELTGTIEIEIQARPGKNDPGRCIASIFARFPAVPDAQYQGVAEAQPPSSDVSLAGPPFVADVATPNSYYFKGAPPGTHQVFLAGGSTGAGCGQALASAQTGAARFAITGLRALTDRPSVSGRVVDLDARPIAGQQVAVFKVAGVTDAPCTATPRPTPDAIGTTNADGHYEIYVEKGEFEVCPAAEAPFTPDLQEVSTEFVGQAIANFVLEGYRLSGTVVDGEEAPIEGATIAAIPLDQADPPGAATTAADGTYEAWLAPGAYDVSASLDGVAGTPVKVAADLTTSDATADFEVVKSPILVEIDEPTAVGPGAFGFTATVVDESGSPLTYEWSFGDEGSSAEAVPTHAYHLPGLYTISLVVSNEIGVRSEPATLELEVLAPELSVVLRGVTSERPAIDPDGSADVEVRIAAGDGLGPLDLALVPTWLSATGTVELEAVPDQPAIPERLVLEPGTSQTFLVRLRGTGVGSYTLAAKVSGVDAAARAVTNEATLEGTVGAPLKVSMTLDPAETAELALKLVEEPDLNNDNLPDGYHFESQTVTVKVTVVNTTDEPITDVALLGTQGGGALNLAVREGGAPTPFPMTVLEPFANALLGTLEPGVPVERTYRIEVSNGGDFEISTLARGRSSSGDVEGPGAVGIKATTDIALVMEVAVRRTPQPGPRVDEGQLYTIDGKLRNVSTGETIEVWPMRIGIEGNEIIVGPNSTDSTAFLDELLSYLASLGDYPTWLYEPTLEPAATSTFVASVASKPLNLPSNLVQRQSSITTYGVEAEVVLPDGTKSKLDPGEILIKHGNGQYVDGTGETHLRVEVTPKLPPVLDIDWGIATLAYLDRYSRNILSSGASAIIATPGVLWNLGAGAVQLGRDGAVYYVETVIALDYLRQLWNETPEDQRREIVARTALELFPRLKKVGEFGNDPEALEKVKQVVADALYGQFTRIDAWFEQRDALVEDGDMVELVRYSAEPANTAGHLLGDWYGGEAILRGTGLLLRSAPRILGGVEATRGAERKAAEAGRIDLAIAEQAKFGRVEDVGVAPRVKAILAGAEQPTIAQAAALFGMDGVSFSNMLKLTDFRNGGLPIIAAFRARAEACVEWVRMGAYWKPEGVYAKNVDRIDELILGYRRGQPGQGGDIGSLILAEPLTWDLVRARIQEQALNAADAALAQERWAIRWEEWHGVRPPRNPPAGWAETGGPGVVSEVQRLKSAAAMPLFNADGTHVYTGYIRVPRKGTIRYETNVDTARAARAELAKTETIPVRFELRSVRNPPDAGAFDGAREYYEVFIDGRRVTGDMDAVLMTQLNGAMLDASMAATVARNMAHLGNLQHGWSSTFNNPSVREKYIREFLWNADPAKRGDPLLLFVNGKAHTAYIKKYFNMGERAEYVTAEGVPLYFNAPAMPDVVVPIVRGLDVAAEPAPQTFSPPTTSLLFAAGVDGGQGHAPLHDVTTTRDPGGRVLQLGESGTIQQWTTDVGWRAVEVGAIADGPGGSVQVAVATGLAERAPAGATRLEVFDPETAAAGAPPEPWFQAGDTVVLNPGGETEELVTVTAIGSLVLAEPTKHQHEPGESIYLLASAGSVPLPMVAAGVGVLVLVLVVCALVLVRRRPRARS